MSNSLSQVLNKRIPNPISDAQSVLFSDITSLEDLYIHLARQQLTPDANSGKQRFYAVVTNIINNPGIQTDPFLSKQYEIARTNGISDKEASSANAVFLHVPALHTFYYEAYDDEATKDKKVTQFDLQKLVAFTTKPLAIRNVVTITFENLKDYTGPIILDVNLDKNDLLEKDRKKFTSSKELFQNIFQCKILAADEAQGYAAFSNTAVKQKPRRGYWSFYLDFINQISTENLVNKIIVSNTTTKLNNDLGIEGNDSATQKANALELFKGVGFTLKANQEVFNYINSQQSLSNSEGLTPKIELDSNLSSKTAISLTVTVTSPNNLKNEIINIIESIVGGYYGFKWESKAGYYLIDPFPDEPIVDAINKSKTLDNLSTQNPESAQITVTESPVEGVPLTDAQKNQATPTTKIKEGTPQCEDQTKINNEIYIKAGSSDSFKRDNKRIKKVNQEKNLSVWHSSIQSILLFDYEAAKKGLPKTGEFIYKNGEPEIISPVEEVEKKPPEQQSKGKKLEPKTNPPKPKSTNETKIKENNKKLSSFVTAFTKFIATNEGIDQNRVFLVPLSVFRPFEKINPGSGRDQNSRHFFNRAIDFVVYLAPNGYNPSESKQLPPEGTFEIPNYIVYCYLLKFINQFPNFAQCSIGLLEKGNPRKTGYVHYEWMGNLDGSQSTKVKINRRWVSNGGAENSLYKKAWGQPDQNKDSIIKNWVLDEVKAKLGILPTKLENLL